MAKQPTLFSFFTKNESPSPIPKPAVKSSAKQKSLIINGKEIKLLDLVWAKLDGYPWWPALVAEHPTEKLFLKRKQIHVQFFDDPPTRGWVKESFIKPYVAPSECGVPTYKDPLWVTAKASADSVLSLPNNERTSLIVNMESSTSEDDLSMESDLDDSDKSKENIDANIGSGKKRLNDDKGKSEPKSKKRRIILLSDSEASGDEYKPGEAEDSGGDTSVSSGVDESEISEIESDTESDMGTPIKETKKPKPSVNFKNSSANRNVSFSSPNGAHAAKSPKTPRLLDTTKSKLAEFSAKATPSRNSSGSDTTSSWPHTKLPWLKPENIRDAMKHSPDHPDFDARTVYVPEDFLNKQTPAMRQWWDIKSRHFDTVLFFKMGKFYELFHMDAILSIQELGLLMMRGDHAHTGFPEIAYGRYSATLIELGYKVARVEQTETPEMMENRCKKTVSLTKFDKVVRRELCQITSMGTLLPSVKEAEFSDTFSSNLLAICERVIEGPGEASKLGVAFIDTSIGVFYLGQFEDDRHLSRLRTLMSHYPPAQILIERGRLSPKAHQLVKSAVSSGLLENLTSQKEFWDASKTLSTLVESEYLKKNGITDWPDALKSMLDEGDTLGLTAKCDYELAVSSLGALIWYLTLCKLEEDLISRRLFEIYSPPDRMHQFTETLPCPRRKHMVLDGNTLKNLEVFQNSSDGSAEGTLFVTLNHCHTAFGKRLLHSWLCSPLCDKAAIDSRLDAIEDLKKRQDIVKIINPLLKSLPDLEKLLSKIHSQGLKHSENHPDSRAIFFDNQQYSQRRVQDFLSAVQGFKTTISVVESFNDIRHSLKSTLLRKCVSLQEEEGRFPSLKKVLQFFDTAFDQSLAKKEGKIIPSKGVDPEYDDAMEKIQNTKEELDDYLKEQSKKFSAKVTYWGNDKKRFQLEVPDHATKNADQRYELVSQKKGYKRYWTETTKTLLSTMIPAEEQRENALQDIARRIYSQFDEHGKEWGVVIECMALLDVLLSLTQYALHTESTRPVVSSLSSEEKPFIDIREGRHPCTIKIFSGGDYIPNNVVISSDSKDAHSNLVLVTGPNMGGKSTLMRQTALICLMAQLGSYVPAAKCHLSAVDRIFTRLGAWDRIYQGESTFYVELAETASIVRHATQHSLVIVDELGRGTATYDGTAIAFSVVDALLKVGCRTLFSTHYHSLVDDFKAVEGVSLGHMACMVECENEEDPSQETITFLYKFAEGSCPKSYGFNAAKLAELPESIIRCASQKAKELEKINIKKKSFQSLFALRSSLSKSSREIISEIKTAAS